MKYLRLAVIILALFAGLSLISPITADAASTSGNKSLKKTSKKVSAKKVSSKQQKTVAVKAAEDADRKVWQKRARESDIYTGKASWYGRDFHNKATASGVLYDMYTFTAAHRTLPMGTVVRVTDQHNGKSVIVCVNDRGPYVAGRIIDLSFAAARKLGLQNRGVSNVKLEVVSDEQGKPLNDNKAYFVNYGSKAQKSSVGPFKAFADAAVMQEALSQAHPEAEVVLENSQR